MTNKKRDATISIGKKSDGEADFVYKITDNIGKKKGSEVDFPL